MAKGIMSNPEIPIGAKGMYCYLSSYSDGKDECFPSYETMAKEMNISEKTVKKHIQTLVEFGILTKRQRRSKGTFSSNMYRIDHNACADMLEGTNELPLRGDVSYPQPEGKKFPTVKVPDGKKLPYDRRVKSSLPPEGKNYPTNNTNINNTSINNNNITHSIIHKGVIHSSPEQVAETKRIGDELYRMLTGKEPIGAI